jgi:hypothetical protein
MRLEGWLGLLLFLVILGFSSIPVVVYLQDPERDVWDYTLWYRTALRYCHGEDIYPRNAVGEFEFMYPPSAPALLAPLTLAGHFPMILALVFLTGAGWIYSILQSLSLSGGASGRLRALVYLIPSAGVIPYVFENYKTGQPTLVLLACLLGAFACLRAKRAAPAGILIALAAAIKAFPLVILPYLIVRGYWKAALWTCGMVLVFLFVVTLPYRKPPEAAHDFQVWSSGMLKFDADGISQRRIRSVSYKNGSLISMVLRFTRPVVVDPGPPPLSVNVAVLPFKGVVLVVGLLSLALGAGFLAAIGRSPPQEPIAQAAEFSMVLILILLAAPLSFVTYSYVFVLLPFTVIMVKILDPQTPSGVRRGMSIALAVAILMLLFTLPYSGFRLIRALGNTFWASLLLLGQLAWILRTSARGAAARSAVSAQAVAAAPGP